MYTMKILAEKLIESGYATEMREVPYGLTKELKTYEVLVNGVWESVNPYGYETHSTAQKGAIGS